MKLPGWMWLDADAVAREGYAAVMTGKPVYVNGSVYRAIAWLARMAPQGFLRRVVARSGTRYRKT
jgi:short-subunit dehydrogenase